MSWLYDKLENIPPSSSTAMVADPRMADKVPNINIGVYTRQVRSGNVSPFGDNNQRPTVD